MELKRYVDLGSLNADGLWDLLREPESKRSEGVGRVDMARFDQAVASREASVRHGVSLHANQATSPRLGARWRCASSSNLPKSAS